MQLSTGPTPILALRSNYLVCKQICTNILDRKLEACNTKFLVHTCYVRGFYVNPQYVCGLLC